MNVLPMIATMPHTDFSQDTWWISIIKALFIVVFLIVSVIMVLWVERRGLGLLQTRPGPNVHGPFGLFQALADAVKLVMKEDFWLNKADGVIYIMAPFIAAFSAFMVYAVIPFGPNVEIFGYSTPLQLTDTPVSVLYILAITSLGVYGIVLGGWSTNTTFSLLGSVRSCAQIVSYELCMGLSLASVFLVSRSMSTSQIVQAQTNTWWAFVLFPAFVIYFISMIGEVNRLPFDLPEAEGELVAGHMIEYSSMKFAWFFLAEYINMFNVSAVATTLFMGGWHAPFGLSYVMNGYFNTGFWPMLWFIGKVWVFIWMMIWIRGTLLRFRYDQFMKIGWKILIPVSLVWMFFVMILQAATVLAHVNTYVIYGVIMTLFLLCVVAIVFMTKDDKKEQPKSQETAVFNPLENGFPVPPLPGQELPISPRLRKVQEKVVDDE